MSNSSLLVDLCFLFVTSSSLHCDWLRQLLYRRLRRTEITAVNSLKLISVNGGDVGDNADEYDGGGGGSDAYIYPGQRSLLSTCFHLFAFGDKDRTCEIAISYF